MLAAPVLLGCGWDRDTLTDEIQRKPTLFDLASGQLPQHSAAWYERNLADALRDPDGPMAADTRAVALIQLGRYDDADRALSAMLVQNPERYETRSNLGVLRKKQGKLGDAQRYLTEALGHRPEGHLGTADHYLRGVVWRRMPDPPVNYLGIPYDAVPSKDRDSGHATWQFVSPLVLSAARTVGEDPPAHDFNPKTPPVPEPLQAQVALLESRLHKLLRYDHSLPDARLVLGDELAVARDLHLALIAYTSALELGHPRTDVVHGRISMVVKHFSEQNKAPRTVEDGIRLAQASRTKASRWVQRFQAQEAQLVARGARPTFEETEAALERRGIRRLRR